MRNAPMMQRVPDVAGGRGGGNSTSSGRYKDDHSRQDRIAQWFWTVHVTPALHTDKCQWSVTCPGAMTLRSGSLKLQRVPAKGTDVLFHIQALCIIMAGRKDWHELLFGILLNTNARVRQQDSVGEAHTALGPRPPAAGVNYQPPRCQAGDPAPAGVADKQAGRCKDPHAHQRLQICWLRVIMATLNVGTSRLNLWAH